MGSTSKRTESSVVDSIVSSVSQDIIDGRYAPGERLVEANLARRYEGGRNSIREAIQQLRASHYIDLEPNKGATVANPDAEEIRSVFQIREMLLGLGARSAADCVKRGEGLTVALRLQEEICEQLGAPDRTHYGADNLRFHSEINRLSGNPYVEEMLAKFRLPILDSIYWRDVSLEGMIEDLKEHADIIRAIVRGDSVAAEHFARQHDWKKLPVAIEISRRINLTRNEKKHAV